MVSLIIPAFNEEKIIRHSIKKALEYFEKNCKDFEIIVVDDGSTDATRAVLSGLDVTVVLLSQNRGKGAAVKEGVLRASGEYIFFTDADLPYSLDFILKAKELLKLCDVVCGKRFGDYPVRRTIVSTAYNSFAQSILNIKIDDVQCGIKGFSKYAARQIFPICRVNGFAFDTEIVFLAQQMGLAIETVNVNIAHRSDSKVKLMADGFEMLGSILKIRNSFEAGEYNFYKGYQG